MAALHKKWMIMSFPIAIAACSSSTVDRHSDSSTVSENDSVSSDMDTDSDTEGDGDADADTDTDGDTDTDADTDTDTDADTDTDTDVDADTDTDIDTDIDVDTDTDSDNDTDTDVDTDTDTDTDTDVDTDTDTDTDTDADADMDTDTDTDMDTAADSDTDTDSGSNAVPPECRSDEDCTLHDDCCSCIPIGPGETAPECPLQECAVSACAGFRNRHESLDAICAAGRCVLNLNCNDEEVTCEQMIPECDDGTVPVIDDSRTCWTNECIPVEQCSDVTNCGQCPEELLCVQESVFFFSTHCVDIPSECAETPDCECMRENVCIYVCGENDEGLSCFCPGC